MHVATRLGSVEGVQLLLSHGASRDAATKDLYTPLHIAVKEGHEDVVKVLLENGAKQNVTTKVKCTDESDCCDQQVGHSWLKILL